MSLKLYEYRIHIQARLKYLSTQLRNQLADKEMNTSNEWYVAVFKCSPDYVKNILVEVYKFVDNLKGVRSLHFLIRDRVEDEVVLSFRVMVEPKFKEIVKTKLSYKLSTLLSEDKYVIDPDAGNSYKRKVECN